MPCGRSASDGVVAGEKFRFDSTLLLEPLKESNGVGASAVHKWPVPCWERRKSRTVYPNCTAVTGCGRAVADAALAQADVDALAKLAERWVGSGSIAAAMERRGDSALEAQLTMPAVLELYSGRLSVGDWTVDDVFATGLVAKGPADDELTGRARAAAAAMVVQQFGVAPAAVHPASPSFFSVIRGGWW